MGIIEYMHKYFFPKFTEITFFNISLISVILFVLYSGVRDLFFKELFSNPKVIFFTIIYIGFILLSVYFGLSKKLPNKAVSPFLVIIGVIFIAVIGYLAGIEIINSYAKVSGIEKFMLIFPVYNILHALTLLIFIRGRMLKPELLYEEKNSDLKLVGINAIFIIAFSVIVFTLGMSAAISASIILFLMDLFEKLFDFFAVHHNDLKA